MNLMSMQRDLEDCKTSHDGLNDLNDMNGQVSNLESYVKFLSI